MKLTIAVLFSVFGSRHLPTRVGDAMVQWRPLDAAPELIPETALRSTHCHTITLHLMCLSVRTV